MRKVNNLINYLNNNGFKKEATYLKKQAFGPTTFLGMILGIGCNKQDISESEELKLCTNYVKYTVKQNRREVYFENPDGSQGERKGEYLYDIYKEKYGIEVVENKKALDILVETFVVANRKTTFEEGDLALRTGQKIMIPNPDEVKEHYELVYKKLEELGVKKEDLGEDWQVKSVKDFLRYKTVDGKKEFDTSVLEEYQGEKIFLSDEHTKGEKYPSKYAMSILVDFDISNKGIHLKGYNDGSVYGNDKPPSGHKKINTIGIGHLIQGKDKVLRTTTKNSKGTPYDIIYGYIINGIEYSDIEKATDGSQTEYKITTDIAEKILQQDIDKRIKQINRFTKNVSLSQNEWDAIFVLFFNNEEYGRRFVTDPKDSLSEREKYLPSDNDTPKEAKAKEKEWDRITKYVFETRWPTVNKMTTKAGRRVIAGGLKKRRLTERRFLEGTYDRVHELPEDKKKKKKK